MSNVSVADQVPFSDICGLFERISNPNLVRQVKLLDLKKVMDTWRDHHTKLHGTASTDDSFFACMRLLLPSFDKERGSYGFKESTLGRKLVNIFGMGKTTDDAKALLNYKGASKDSDFAGVASKILGIRLSKKSAVDLLTITLVNNYLDVITLANANNDQKELDRQLQMLCRSVDQIEFKWLVRILLKQMNLRMGESTILNTFHPQGSQYYDVTTCLHKVCLKCHDAGKTLDEIQVELFSPFRPMLAARVDIDRCVSVMDGPFYVEIKYDGERVQIHKKADRYVYFTRNGNDVTSSYGGTCSTGSLTPRLANMFSASVDECILDAEMVGWNTQAKCFATKGENYDVKSLKVGEIVEPCVVVFDCLHLNGQVVTTRPLTERLAMLQTVFVGELEGTLHYAKHELKHTTADLIQQLNDAVEKREEGVVVKSPTSTYRLNVRNEKAGWVKIKPDYVDGMCDNMDLLILGAYMGDGIRANLLSHFLLGVYDQQTKQYVSVCKVGSGYSLKQLYDLNVHLTRNAQMVKADKDAPEWLRLGSERAQVYIHPQYSKVLEVKAAEITVSTGYATGLTLRFPRVEKIRDDKGYNDCMTLQQFIDKSKEDRGKIANKLSVSQVGNVGENETSPRKRKVGASVGIKSKKATVGAQFTGADLGHVRAKNHAFQGKELCIINGNSEMDKKPLEVGAAKLGAKITQNPGDNTWCVVAGKKILKVNNVIKRESHNVVKAEWLIRCISLQTILPWLPDDMIFTTETTQNSFNTGFDKFGDSFTQPITEKDLHTLLQKLPPQILSHNELTDVIFDVYPDYKYALFAPYRLYFDVLQVLNDKEKGEVIDSPLELTRQYAKLYGAWEVCHISSATHVVLDQKDLTRYSQILEWNRGETRKVRIVSEEWICQSIKAEKVMNERHFGI